MDSLIAVKRGVPGAQMPALRERRVPARAQSTGVPETTDTVRSDVASDNSVPTPPFWGARVVRGISLADYLPYLDERALFMGQWGLKSIKGGQSYEEIVETEARPRLRHWLDRIQRDAMIEPALVYGYFPCYADGNDLVIVWHEGELKGEERVRLSFPRQRRDRRLCLSDFFRTKESGELDVVSFQIVTMGQVVADAAAVLFAADAYRDYLELHGLSVQLTEALAEFWHARTRDELGFSVEDSGDMDALIAKQAYRGSRYSFGYPACPDLEQQTQLVELLDPDRIGVSLSEEFQLHPEQSTSAIVLHHPEAKYFNAT
jgi:5-methyltetrahydrofolate--homocysteine methyltransferase